MAELLARELGSADMRDMRSMVRWLGAGAVVAVLAFGTAQTAPTTPPGGSAVPPEPGGVHRPLGGQTTSGGGRSSQAIRENDCLDQGGTVSRALDCSGTHKACETVTTKPDGSKSVVSECVDAD